MERSTVVCEEAMDSLGKGSGSAILGRGEVPEVCSFLYYFSRVRCMIYFHVDDIFFPSVVACFAS